MTKLDFIINCFGIFLIAILKSITLAIEKLIASKGNFRNGQSSYLACHNSNKNKMFKQQYVKQMMFTKQNKIRQKCFNIVSMVVSK